MAGSRPVSAACEGAQPTLAAVSAAARYRRNASRGDAHAALARAAPKCTSPTGFTDVPPPGPATPVTETAMSARECSKRAFGHRARHLSAHRAILLDQRRGHAEHLGLRLVRIGDEAALEDVGRAGHLRQDRGDQPARAGFRRRELQSARAAGGEELRRFFDERVESRAHDAAGSATVAIAIATIPSPRPVKPIFSLVVAFTPTRVGVDAGDLGDARAHLVAMRTDLRRLADERHVEIDDPPAFLAHAAHGVGKEAVGRRALPFRIGGREVLADVAVADGAEQRIGQRVQPDVGVRVADEAMVVRRSRCRRARRPRPARRRARRSPGRCASRSRSRASAPPRRNRRAS